MGNESVVLAFLLAACKAGFDRRFRNFCLKDCFNENSEFQITMKISNIVIDFYLVNIIIYNGRKRVTSGLELISRITDFKPI